MDRPASEMEASEKEKELRKKDKKKGLTKEQREMLMALEQERQRVRQERIDTLARKLVDRLSIWTEDDKGDDSTLAFKEKIRMEAENLKMESFGVEILHAIGVTYNAKAATLLRSQNFLGSIGGFFSRIRDKGTVVKETWHTISSAIDAQQTVEEMARMELEGGDNWTDEKKAEYERRVSGKILTAVWRMSKSEITSVLRAVCDSVLHDKAVPIEKRLERAKAMILIADVFMKVRGEVISVGGCALLSTNVRSRPSAPPRRRATTWRGSSSLPTPPSRRTRRPSARARTAAITTITTTRTARTRRRRRQRQRQRHLGTCRPRSRASGPGSGRRRRRRRGAGAERAVRARGMEGGRGSRLEGMDKGWKYGTWMGQGVRQRGAGSS
jgi:hypothetical protein